MKYSDLVLQHFNHSQNVGQLLADENIYQAEAGISGGDKVKLFMNITVDGKITDARYQVKGCPAMIACMSWMASELIGVNILDAKEITSSQISLALDLPVRKQHCALLAEEVLQKILTQVIDD